MDERRDLAEKKPEITLKDLANQKDAIKELNEEKDEELQKVEKRISTLTEEDKKKITELKEGINLLDSQLSVQYGVGAQRNLSTFSDTILSNIKAKDAGEVGVLMTELMEKVRGLDIESIDEKGGFFSNLPFVKNVQNNIDKLMGKYEMMEIQIDKIEDQLDKARLEMLKDIAMFDTLYQKNLEYFNDLQLYIIAGEEKLEETRNNDLPRLREEAIQSGEPMDAQLVSDFEETLNRFERKLHDLKLSKTLAIQTAPQIKLIQNNDKLLVDKIQTAILNTIPLWKSQIVIALGLNRQENALRMQKAVTDTTNELLRRNSEMIKQNTIGVAKESERGMIELETLKKVNEDLITTIQETIKIQRDGRQKRLQVEAELTELEGKLRETLLSTVREK
ncbi:MAG: toxic anion resistance protein [Tissierellia bacterium]|nr:toxic anion resistance protein [Tissierellia bacterium]